MNQEQIAALVQDQIRSIGQFGAVRDLLAALIAERANQSANPIRFLDLFIEDERNAVYRASALSDNDSPMLQEIQRIQIETKEGIFELARGVIASPHR